MVLEDSFGDTQLVGITEEKPSTVDELLALIERSMSWRKTESTSRNDSSSRTHAICRIRISNPDLPAAPEGVLYLIDLAGSEAAADIADHTQERMKETIEINKSLSILKDCIRGRANLDLATKTGSSSANLRAIKKAHIPFRHSVLTKVLKHVFDPMSQRECKTAVIACVCPSLANVAQGRSTLRFAEMLRVQAPKAGPVQYDRRMPFTWSNIQTREWITNNVSPPNPRFTNLFHCPRN
jgi:kinesin family protein 2/24